MNDYSKVIFIQEILEIIKFANLKSIPIYIVTNQAGVAHGYFDEDSLINFSIGLLDSLYEMYGIYVDGLYYCKSHPEPKSGGIGKICKCRKPAPGLLSAAIIDSGGVQDKVGIVGDSDLDVAAGINAGLKYNWLVSETNRAAIQNEVLNWMSEGLKQ